MGLEQRRLEREVSARFYLFATSVLLYLPVVLGPVFRSAGYEVFYLISPPLVLSLAGLLAVSGLITAVWSWRRGANRAVAGVGGVSVALFLAALATGAPSTLLVVGSATLATVAGLAHLLEAAAQEKRQRRGQ